MFSEKALSNVVGGSSPVLTYSKDAEFTKDNFFAITKPFTASMFCLLRMP